VSKLIGSVELGQSHQQLTPNKVIHTTIVIIWEFLWSTSNKYFIRAFIPEMTRKFTLCNWNFQLRKASRSHFSMLILMLKPQHLSAFLPLQSLLSLILVCPFLFPFSLIYTQLFRSISSPGHHTYILHSTHQKDPKSFQTYLSKFMCLQIA
jgi:hypothetical protein